MLKISSEILQGLKQASSAEDLRHYMQLAIELEHATIPPYLTAQFSIMNGHNQKIKELIHSVVIEEMLHMCIASNILNALGGSPSIDTPEFIPAYPGKLPMNIGDGLQVGLKKLSKEQVHEVFMKIEEPENPIHIDKITDLKMAEGAFVPEDFHTIGEFYDTMKQKIMDLPGGDTLPGDQAKQVTSDFYASDELFPILTKKNAVDAIDIIVEQGEGATSPYDEKGELAHYYKFYEIFEGRQIETISQDPPQYAFSGPEIPFQPDGVYNLYPNTKLNDLPEGSKEYRMAYDFAAAYNRLLAGLHQVFNGHPGDLSKTFGLMYDVKLNGEKLCATAFPGKSGQTIGLPFEYVKLPGASPSGRKPGSKGDSETDKQDDQKEDQGGGDPPPGGKPGADLKKKGKGCLPVLAAAFMIIAIFLLFGQFENYTFTWLQEAREDKAFFSLISFLLLTSDVLLPVPSSVVMYTNGLVLGIAGATLLSVAALMCGTLIAYYLGKLTARGLKASTDSHASELIRKYGSAIIFFTRGIPVLSESISLVCGYNRLPLKKYLLLNLAGYIPVAAVYAVFGSMGYNQQLFLISFACSLLLYGLLWISGKQFLRIQLDSRPATEKTLAGSL